jgi:DNA polymerase III epsilon subunit-like protein
MLKRILARWSRDLGELPCDYITYDLETTGVEADDLIVELGYCSVIDGIATEYHSHVLDWTQISGIDDDWLQYRLQFCADNMRKNNRVAHMTYERMKTEGSHPEIVLREYVELFEEARDNNVLIVGHNAVQFDNPRVESAAVEWLGLDDWTFPNLVFDTAAVVKATLTQMPPHRDESLQEYFLRVLERPAPNVKYNLDSYCVEKFGLLDKYSIDISMSHTAGFDAMLTHLLFEEIRNSANDIEAILL